VGTHEVLEGPEVLNYVMELAAGGDLFEFVSTRGPCDEHRARSLFAGILAGIDQVHRSGLMHRDIKLENILLMHPEPTLPEQVRLADFEFSVESPAFGPVGSLAYSAPEALDPDRPYTTAVDLWAAGVALYAMLSASPPFDCPFEAPAATEQQIRNTLPLESSSKKHAGSRSPQLRRISSAACSIPVQQNGSAWSLHCSTLGSQAAQRSNHKPCVLPQGRSSLCAVPGTPRRSAGATRQQTALVAKVPWQCL